MKRTLINADNIYLSASPIFDSTTFTITSGGSGSVTVGSSPDYGEISSLTKSDYSPIVIDISSDVEPICNGLG